MSQSIRQSNLFASEDFTKIYQSFKNVDFQAYDFDTLKSALVTYVKDQFPEDFNDYIESSEFIAIIELLAYLGTSLAFRTDLNSRENFMDTAERRESIIRLARMVNYQPKRNIPAEGLFKLSGVSTTEPLTDSLGVNISNGTIYWNDENNNSSYEQIVTILNAAFRSSNTFGRPFKKGTIAGVKTHLYRFNSVPFTNVTYPISIQTEGGSYPVDIINPDFNDGETIFERHPNPENPMHLIYRNDNNGLDSIGTGFFLHFKQGTLTNEDFTYEFPLENRVEEVNSSNVNNNDVYVQKIQDEGTVLEEWTKVPSIVGSNVVYNNIALDTKTIFSVISGLNDTVSIKYSDGNFGEVPKDTMRVWTRSSANENIIFRPESVVNKSISIPYIANNGQEHTITLLFNLDYTVANRSLSETNDEIKENAPQVFYTQDRMVNSEDYNVFPLTRGNEIAKIRAVNRTHAGHSRFIDVNDPTGQHSDVVLFAEDGAIYKEPDESRTTAEITDIISVDDIIAVIQTQLKDVKLRNFFYDIYIADYKANMLTLQNGDVIDYFTYPVLSTVDKDQITWNSLPATTQNDTGYFGEGIVSAISAEQVNNSLHRFVKAGSKARFVNPVNPTEEQWVTITSIQGTGQVGTLATTGPVTLSAEIKAGWSLVEIIPHLRTELTEIEKYGDVLDPLYNYIALQIEDQHEFAISYDLYNDLWNVVLGTDINEVEPFSLIASGGDDSSWLLNANFTINEGVVYPEYEFITRGLKYVFESAEEIRFFFEPDQKILDIETGKSLQDEIVITNANHAAKETEEWTYDMSTPAWNYDTLSTTTGNIVLRCRDNISSASAPTGVVVLYNGVTIAESDVDINQGIMTIGLITGQWPAAYADGDIISIIYNSPAQLKEDVLWNISDTFVMPDGYIDQRKVAIEPIDSDEDGVPNNPMSFDAIVNQMTDKVFFEKYTDFDEYEYFRVWQGVFVNHNNMQNTAADQVNDLELEIDGVLFTTVNLITTTDRTAFILELNTFKDPYIANNKPGGIVGTVVFDGISFYTITFVDSEFSLDTDDDHYARTGRSFAQNNGSVAPFVYKWKHFAQSTHRIDPSISNIQDMLIMTQTYYDDVIVWKKDSGSIIDFPAPLTTEELRIQFAELNNFKMLSDQIVFEAGRFKILFGEQADPQLHARFKVVKLPNAVLSDNEIKSKVIDAIDDFFAIANWDFGEAFYYTELAAYIHQELQKSVASVVIVPVDAESEFGNLFQIRAEVNELFISTATVNHIDIVKSLTESNLRIR